MNPDDESALSAFLDDELDPGDRQSFAWAIESSPALARQLADLQATQAALHGLDRPTIPVDLTAAILTRAATLKQPRRPARAGVPRFAAMLAGVASLAACLIFAIIMIHEATHETTAPALIAEQPAPSDRTHPSSEALADQEQPLVAARAASRSNIERVDMPAPAPLPAPEPVAAAPAGPVKVAQARAAVAEAAEPASLPAERVDAMVGQGKLLRALIVTDSVDRDAATVQDLIKRDGARRGGFGRLTVAQGIVVDPNHPGAAEVYAVTIDRPGADPFLDRLRAAFPGLAVDHDPEPALVTSLAEVGSVVLFGDDGAPRLGNPPTDLRSHVAAKAQPDADLILRSPLAVAPAGDGERDVAARSTAMRLRKAGGVADAAPVAAPAADAAQADRDEGPVTVLVWVAARAPSR